MPTRERVQSFIDAVVGGDHVQAILDYYHEDASMQENHTEPRRGREVLMQFERDALEKVQYRMHTHPVQTLLVDGDRVVIRWVFDITDAKGQVRRLDELSLQAWRGDRIQTEQFFYDSKVAWQAV